MKKSSVVPIFVYIILTTIFISGWWAFENKNIHEYRTIASTISKQLSFRLSDNIRYHIDDLYNLKSDWEHNPFENRDEFQSAVNRILNTKGGFQAINFVDTTGTIAWVVPEETNIGALGKNLHNHQDHTVIETFLKAESEKKLRFTPPIHLFQGGMGYASYLPVIVHNRVVGYINGVFRINDIIEYCLSKQDMAQFVYYIDDNSQEIYRSSNTSPEKAIEILGSFSVPVFDRFWTVYVTLSPNNRNFPSIFSRIFLIFGVVVIMIISWLIRIVIIKQLQVKKSESEYKFLVQNIDVGVFISRNNEIIYSNSKLSSITGFERIEIIGKSPYDLFQSDYHDLILKQEQNSDTGLLQQEVIESELNVKSGSEKWVRMTVISIIWEGLPSAIFLLEDITDYKLAYGSLQRIEKRYRFLFENIQDAVIVHDGHNILFVNDAAMQMIGTDDMNKIIGANISQFIHPDYKHFVEKRLKKMKSTNEPLPLAQEVMINFKGEKLTVEVSSGPITFDGKTAYQVIIRNITHRVKMAQELADREVYYRTLFNSNSESVMILKENRVFECNDHTLELFKCQSSDMIGHSPFIFSTKLQADGKPSISEAEKHIDSALSQGRDIFEWQFIDKKEKEFQAEVSLNRIEISKETYLFAVIRDVTEFKKTQKIEQTLLTLSQAAISSESTSQLYEQIHKHLSRLMDTSNMFIALYDEFETMIRFSYFIDENDSHPENSIARKGLTEYVIHTGEPKIFYLENIITMEKSKEIEVRGTRPQIWLGAPMKVSGRVMGVIAVQSYSNPYEYDANDLEILNFVAEQTAISINTKENEQSLKQSEKKYRNLSEKLAESNAMKELLLDVVSHDLKNPAGVLSGMSEIMISENPDDEYAQIIRDSCRNLLNVIDNASSISKLVAGEALDTMKLDLNKLLKDVASEFEPQLKASGMSVEFKLTDESVIWNNPIISEVFKNYIANAINFASFGKKIIIETRKEDGFITVNVIDFGNTIPKEDYVKVFRRGIQLGEGIKKGRGLGLSIVKRISEGHNAAVGIRPNQPTGNIFYLKLPLRN